MEATILGFFSANSFFAAAFQSKVQLWFSGNLSFTQNFNPQRQEKGTTDIFLLQWLQRWVNGERGDLEGEYKLLSAKGELGWNWGFWSSLDKVLLFCSCTCFGDEEVRASLTDEPKSERAIFEALEEVSCACSSSNSFLLSPAFFCSSSL